MTPPFRADHVGSLLRPAALKQAFRDRGAGRIDDETFDRIQDEAIRDAVKLQEAVPALEPVDLLKRRLDEAARYIDGELLGISRQCGFASTVAGNPLSEADMRAKLARCVEVAETVWR